MASINIPDASQVYLDANVFIYAAEVPTRFPQLMTLLGRLDKGDLVAVTSALTLAEVLVAPLKAGNTALGLAYRTRITTGPSLRVVDVSRVILIAAATLGAATPTIKLPDAIHAATCMAAGCAAFLTDDARIKGVAGLPVILLADLA